MQPGKRLALGERVGIYSAKFEYQGLPWKPPMGAPFFCFWGPLQCYNIITHVKNKKRERRNGERSRCRRESARKKGGNLQCQIRIIWSCPHEERASLDPNLICIRGKSSPRKPAVMGVKNREGINMVSVACGNRCFFRGFKEVDAEVSPHAETVQLCFSLALKASFWVKSAAHNSYTLTTTLLCGFFHLGLFSQRKS